MFLHFWLHLPVILHSSISNKTKNIWSIKEWCHLKNSTMCTYSTYYAVVHINHYGFWSIFFSVYSAVFVFMQMYVAIYITSEFPGFTSCLHSLGTHFPRLYINSFQEKQHLCSRTCYWSRFSNEHCLIPFNFHLNQKLTGP